MHLQLRAIYLLFILLFFLNCAAKDVRLADPATPEESAKQGVVAFGIYICAGYLIVPETEFKHHCMEIRDITLVEIVSIDHKSKIIETIPSTLKDDFITSRDNRSNLFSYERNAIHTILIQDVKKRYAIESFRIYLSAMHGKKVSPLFACSLDVYESFKTLPVQANAGDIKFLGIFTNVDGRMKPNPSFPLCSLSNNLNHDFRISESYGRIPSLNREDSSISKHKLRGFDRLYFLGSEVDPKNTELKFLRDFIDNQKEGYWRIKAEERLAALGYKYENGFVMEETKKK